MRNEMSGRLLATLMQIETVAVKVNVSHGKDYRFPILKRCAH